MDAIERKINRAMLEGVVSKEIFCYVTNEVLDSRNAVAFKVRTTSGYESQKVVKAEVFEETKRRLEAVGYTVEDVLDGRELYR